MDLPALQGKQNEKQKYAFRLSYYNESNLLAKNFYGGDDAFPLHVFEWPKDEEIKHKSSVPNGFINDEVCGSKKNYFKLKNNKSSTD